MPNAAWKSFERKVAKYFGTKRVVRGDWGSSAPDIVVDASSFLQTYDAYDKFIVECKYSKDQSWNQLITKAFNSVRKSDRLCVAISEGLVLWKMEDTKALLNFIDINLPLADVLENLYILPISRKPADYILQHLKQCNKYITDLEMQGSALPIVALGQKNSRHVILYTEIGAIGNGGLKN